MLILDENGNKIVLYVVSMWTNKNINYIAYIDSEDKMYASRYIVVDNTIKLTHITDEKEWDYVENYLQGESL